VLALIALPAAAQVDLSRYVALGDSLTAGFASSSLNQYYQERSYPALLAQQGGSSVFEMPLVSEPGIPPILELVSLSPTIIGASSATPGAPINATLATPYNNLGVPGSTLFDMLFTTGDITNLLAGNQDNVMHDLILRNGVNPAIEQAIGLSPTFVTVWIGNNDVLTAALAATPIEGVTMTPVDIFEQLYPTAIGALVQSTGANMALINIPDVTALPFLNTVAPFVDVPGVGVIPLQGENGPLTEDTLVTLTALERISVHHEGLPGFPPLRENLDLATGAPGYILRPEEIQAIQDRINAFNDVIDATAAQFGFPVLDINQRFTEIAGGDRWILGGIEISADFLIGGIFSYDGIHPQSIGYALVAVELIDLINEHYGASIPQVNMDQVLCDGGCADQGGPSLKALQEGDIMMTAEAFEQLYKLMGPKLPESPRRMTRAPAGRLTAQ
jgi:lysophospholipase L1-like esterase